MEEMGGVAALVTVADGWEGKGELGLLDIAGGCDNFRGFARWRAELRGGSFATRESIECGSDLFDDD
jgi:hypothetical protein